MAAFLTVIVHHKHGKIIAAFEPKLTGLSENNSTRTNRTVLAF